jgi:PiT family inorganic phosphate transporter
MLHFFENINFRFDIYAHLSTSVWLLIVLALSFDFLNGLHDAANSVATVVSTRVLSPHMAIIWAAFFNFVAFVVFPTKVASTIQSDIIDPNIVNDHVIAATLLAACGWNLITWYWGLPTSSSHALIGGLIGGGLGQQIYWNLNDAELHGGDYFGFLRSGLIWVLLFIVLAPMIGMALGGAIMIGVTWLCRHLAPRRVDKIFRRLQLISAAFFSLGHGGNDAQKTMGIITVLLVAASRAGAGFDAPAKVPTEVVLSCHLAMGLGTLCGGWRIVKTMGQRIIRLRPIDGACAETGAALVLATTTFVKGIPISTTHTITGAILGVGSLKRFSAVRWGVAGRVIWAWILTIPCAALVAVLAWWLIHLLG